MCIYHILFIHSSISGHVCSSHLLAVVSNASMDMDVQISLWDPAFSSFGYLPRNRISGPHRNSIFNFSELPAILFSIAAALFYVPTNSIRVPISSYPYLLFFVFLIVGILMGEVVSHCGFDLHFFNKWCWASLHVLIGHLYIFFGEMSFQIPCLVLSWIVCFCYCCWMVEVLLYFGY